MIIWNAEKLLRLEDAIQACQNGETPVVELREKKHTWEWPLEEAIAIHTEAKADLDIPQLRYPENKEGPEP